MIDLLASLRRHPALRKWKFEKRGKKSAAKIVLGIAQVHPVLSGKFAGWQARKIAKIQEQIFRACVVLHDDFGVRAFGEEGLSGSGEGGEFFRMGETDLARIRSAAVSIDRAGAFLRSAAARWRTGLKRRDAARAEEGHDDLLALHLLQAFFSDVAVFPIEQRDVHGAVGEGIAAIQREISGVESSSAFRSYRSKGGKGLTQEEYDAAMRYNALIERHNATLSSPERDRAIFREALLHGEKSDVTVFVLGCAHRSRMLRIAAQYLSADTMFVWATPPALWRWKAWLVRVSVAAIAIALLGAIFAL